MRFLLPVFLSVAAVLPARSATVTITMKNSEFGPGNAPMTIAEGDTVRWVNQDTVPHTVTSGVEPTPDGRFDSGNVAVGADYSHTFAAPGVFPYFCVYHNGMASQITVVKRGKTVNINIKNFQFGAGNAPVTVNVGDTVHWTNQDAVTHTVTSGANRVADGKFDKSLTANQTFDFTFVIAGDYPYYCKPHAAMVSSIKVVAPPPAKGDLNGDGAVTAADVTRGCGILGGMTSLSSGGLTAADIYPAGAPDGAFDLRDVERLVRHVAGLDPASL